MVSPYIKDRAVSKFSCQSVTAGPGVPGRGVSQQDLESQDEVCHSRAWSPRTRCVTAGSGVPGRGVSQQDLESKD